MRQALFLVSFVFICGLHSGAQQTLDLPTLIPFKKHGKFGFKTQSNQVVIPPLYQNVGLFVNGKAFVSKDINGKRLTGVIDTTDKEVVPIKYRLDVSISNRGQGFVTNGFIAPDACYTLITDEDKYINRIGVLDRNGDMILEPDYSYIQPRFHDSVGLVFEVRKRIESKEKTAIFNSQGKCIYPFATGDVIVDWRKQMRGLPKNVEPTKEQQLKADTTKPYRYVMGLQYRGFASTHAIVQDKKTNQFGVYNVETKTYVLLPTYRYIHAFGHGYLVCALPDKKAKIQVYNNRFLLIDSLDEKRAFNHYWGSQFAFTLSDVVYSGNYKPLNQEGNLSPKVKHFEKLGVVLILDKNLNTVSVFDTLGNTLFQTQLTTKYLYDIYPFNEYIEKELEQEESIDSMQKIVRIAFAPLSEKPVLNSFGLSADEQYYYGFYRN